jgi:tetratricopeptide (TPR) repeat protein
VKTLPRTLTRTLAAALLSVAPCALVAGPLCERPAAAQPAPNDAAKRAARELADKGYEHYEAGEYAQAVVFFRQAESKFHAPSILLMQANAHEKQGQLVEALPLYERVASEPLAGDAPQEFRDAQAEAKATLERVKLRIATLKIVLKGMTPDRVTVTIDDVEIPPDKVLQPIPANPGTRRIQATIGGDESGRAVFQSVTLKEGMTKQIQLVFRPGTPAGPPPSSAGCASCEVTGPRPGQGAAAGVVGSLVVALLLALRRREGPCLKARTPARP